MSANQSDNVLLDCYRRYVGDLESVTEVNVYGGAALALGGLVLTVAGWLGFFLNELGEYGTPSFYTTRELVIAAAGLGVAAFLLGVVTLLVGTARTTAVAGVGVGVCVAAVLFFVVTYPTRWDTPAQFNAPIGVSLYGLGLLTTTFAVGSAYSCRVTDGL